MTAFAMSPEPTRTHSSPSAIPLGRSPNSAICSGKSRVDLVVDVRSMPRSRTNPQFNDDSLPETLAPWQIGYEHIAALGGLRGKARNVALTEPFAAGLAQLRELAGQYRCAIMCAEAVWWRCHRRIITDYLLVAGERVMHILGTAHIDEASLTPGALVYDDGRSSIQRRVRNWNNETTVAST